MLLVACGCSGDAEVASRPPPDADVAIDPGGGADGASTSGVDAAVAGDASGDAVATPLDASVAPRDTGADGQDGQDGVDAAATIPELADCLGSPYEMHVVATTYAALDGVFHASGARGTWSLSPQTAALMQLDIRELPVGPWLFAAATDIGAGHLVSPGTYVSGAPGTRFPYAQLEVEGKGCGGIPTGTFTIVELGITGGLGSGGHLLAWFDLTCGAQGHRARGCVRYGR